MPIVCLVACLAAAVDQQPVLGSSADKAAVPRRALLRHVLLTHTSNVISGGFLSSTVYACLPLLKESGALNQRQITRMLTVGTGCFVFGKLSTAHAIEAVGPKAAFSAVNVVGGLMCLMLASGIRGELVALWWCVYKMVGATSWPAIVQMLQYWASREDSVKAFSLYSTGSRTGAIAASLGVGLLVHATDHGWRIALGGAGVAALATFFVCNALVHQQPRLPLTSRDEQAAPIATSPIQAPLTFRSRLHSSFRLLYDPLKARTLKLKERQARWWRSRTAFKWQAPQLVSLSPDDVVLLKPPVLLRMFARRPNFWLAIGAAMGYSPIRQFEALLPLFLSETAGAGAAHGSAAATAYHLSYWLSAAFGNAFYFQLTQAQQLLTVSALLAAHVANLVFMGLAWPIGPIGQIACMAVMGGTIAVPATGVLNIFIMDLGKADGAAMLSSLLDAAGAFSTMGFFGISDAARARFGWSGVLFLLAAYSAWTLTCEVAILVRDLIKFRRGYVVNRVRTRGSLHPRFQKDTEPKYKEQTPRE